MRLDTDRHYRLASLILIFFILSFMGWLWEVVLYIFYEHSFINRGVLFGPWLPIYGCGTILILILLQRLARHVFLLFFAIMLLAGIIEYSTSWYLETFKGTRWWDYRDFLFNIQGRVCLIGLVIFGIGGCLLIYYLAPWLDKMLLRLSPNFKRILCIVLLFCFAVDFIYSIKSPNTGKGISFPVLYTD